MANDSEQLRILAILRNAQLPDTLTLAIGDLPPGADAAYDPDTDTLALARGTPALTILHEGAHAEHYRRANLVKALPNDVNARAGIRLASEAYVGLRLASFPGFVESEHSALSQLGLPATIGAWAAEYEAASDLRGSGYDGTLFSMSAFRVLLRVIPVVVAERKNAEVIVGADLERAVPTAGDALRAIVAATVQLARKEERLFDLSRVRALGKNSIERLAG